MSTPIYSKTNYKQNIILYWQQYFPQYQIPKGYHVHHIYPKSLCKQEGWTEEQIHHPKNLIVLHPDDHQSIHLCRGDKRALGGFLSIKGLTRSQEDLKRAAQKGLRNKLKNVDEHGLNSNQRGNIKAIQTKRSTIGLDGIDMNMRGVLRSIETKNNDIDENGLNGHQRAGIKTADTKANDIVDGLNSHQREAIKAAETKRNNVDENGNDVYRKSATKRSVTMLERNKRKYPDLYDKKKFIKAWVFCDVIQKAKCINTCKITRYQLETVIKYHGL